MAIQRYGNAFISINGVDLSDHISEVTIETERDEHEITTMGAANKVFVLGLGDANVTISIFQDYAAAEVDATLFPLSTTDTPFAFAFRPVNAAISATNPEYQMTVLMPTYTPVSARVSAVEPFEVSFRNASSTGLVRDVTP